MQGNHQQGDHVVEIVAVSFAHELLEAVELAYGGPEFLFTIFIFLNFCDFSSED